MYQHVRSKSLGVFLSRVIWSSAAQRHHPRVRINSKLPGYGSVSQEIGLLYSVARGFVLHPSRRSHRHPALMTQSQIHPAPTAQPSRPDFAFMFLTVLL